MSRSAPPPPRVGARVGAAWVGRPGLRRLGRPRRVGPAWAGAAGRRRLCAGVGLGSSAARRARRAPGLAGRRRRRPARRAAEPACDAASASPGPTPAVPRAPRRPTCHQPPAARETDCLHPAGRLRRTRGGLPGVPAAQPQEIGHLLGEHRQRVAAAGRVHVKAVQGACRYAHFQVAPPRPAEGPHPRGDARLRERLQHRAGQTRIDLGQRTEGVGRQAVATPSGATRGPTRAFRAPDGTLRVLRTRNDRPARPLIVHRVLPDLLAVCLPAVVLSVTRTVLFSLPSAQPATPTTDPTSHPDTVLLLARTKSRLPPKMRSASLSRVATW